MQEEPMGGYLENYGEGDERRIRVIKMIVFSVIGLIVLSLGAYLFLHDYSEKQTVKRFLADLNSKQYENAYRDWGCTASHPCPNYSYSRFMDDWGPAKTAATSPWKIASVDGCKMFVTVNVQADGRELQSLSVARQNNELGYAPSPECQERKLHFKAFFQRLFGGS
jgi:hypothetical protein